ncbi:MAG: adenylate/guanylate cyclase domain-containing protein [SAR324 cluster bacterium]|jgi:class 3 adenylate cyclase|nr:adenylate/guanylate cyclase domain-containing protein [SAR324 cluster bacterium]MCH2267383.1 adenylate/guanylate cyclase domain-containing protein [SAR324 cluster bacterium]
MKIEDFFNQKNIIDLSFFNFSNAITACYYARENLEILKVNDNFLSFFPILGNVNNVYFPDVLEQIGLPGKQIEEFVRDINEKGMVLIPEIKISIDGKERIYFLLSTRTKNDSFTYLNGVQGQFVDRTVEFNLRKERQNLLDEKIRDREIIEEKSRQLASLAKRLAKYLSPQIYQSIFKNEDGGEHKHARKNLTIFLSDIVKFTDLADTLEPERLATVINSYLSEMSLIAVECGGTIDKFIGDAVLIFFGDPETEGETEDALKCAEMAIRMLKRVGELNKHWKKLGVIDGLKVRMGIATGFCTVGNFGSDLRLDYTVLGSPVNMAARLQTMAEHNSILIDEYTKDLINDHVSSKYIDEITPKGFARPVQVYRINDFKSAEHRNRRKSLTHVGERVEVSVLDSSNIRAAIEELKHIQEKFERDYADLEDKKKNLTS